MTDLTKYQTHLGTAEPGVCQVAWAPLSGDSLRGSAASRCTHFWGNADVRLTDNGPGPGKECRCRDSGKLGGCAEREGGCDGEDEGVGKVHDEGNEVQGTSLSENAQRES